MRSVGSSAPSRWFTWPAPTMTGVRGSSTIVWERKQTTSAAYNRLIAAPIDILILCTGNICRSPMAEGMLRAKLEERGVAATVSSAGLSFYGRPPTEEAMAVAEAYGVDITDHTSRMLHTEMLAADLIIAMERLHLREAVVLDSTVLERCFTLKELVRRAEETGARRVDEPLGNWLARVGRGRRLV